MIKFKSIKLEKNIEIGEDELLDSFIKENSDYFNDRKYRLSAKPLPNHEKNVLKNVYTLKIKDIESKRLGDTDKLPSKSNNSGKKKVLKKPAVNFGGGILGGRNLKNP